MRGIKKIYLTMNIHVCEANFFIITVLDIHLIFLKHHSKTVSPTEVSYQLVQMPVTPNRKSFSGCLSENKIKLKERRWYFFRFDEQVWGS